MYSNLCCYWSTSNLKYKKLVNILQKHNSMEKYYHCFCYHLMTPAILQFIAPYTGTSIVNISEIVCKHAFSNL